MPLRTRTCGTRFPAALSLALGFLFSASALADDTVCSCNGQHVKGCKNGDGVCGRRPLINGALGYAPPGAYPGFYGFGLGFHLGYGYGGKGLGVGTSGGYPCYAGPGYPHPWPELRRCGPIVPFPYYGGPGNPTPNAPNYYGATGPLVANRPVVTVGDEFEPIGVFGFATGALPYTEAFLAPFTTKAASGGAYSGPNSTDGSAPGRGAAPDGGSANVPSLYPALGIEAQPVVDANGTRGLRVSKVDSGAVGEKAGLHVGDVLQSINGYKTEQPGNIPWIIANAASDKVLTISLRSPRDTQDRTVRAQLR
jgi:hypothetical protein